jgi:uncharacterized protein (DUF433 family)
MARPIHGIEIVHGVAVLYRRAVTTDEVMAHFMMGEPPEQVARAFRITPEDVERAIRYECCRRCDCGTCAWARDITESQTGKKGKAHGRGEKT